MPKAPSGKSRRRPEQPKLVTNSIKYKTEGPGAKSSRTSPSFPPSKISIVPAEKELDLDTLFATVKKGSKDTKQSSSEPEPRAKIRSDKVKRQKVEGSKDNIFGETANQNRRRTEEGYVIYSEKELQINRGGGTDKCPFDCQCCF